LNEGMLLFRRPESAYLTAEVVLRGLDPEATYKLSYESTNKRFLVKGKHLMHRFEITIPLKHRSELITYRKVTK